MCAGLLPDCDRAFCPPGLRVRRSSRGGGRRWVPRESLGGLGKSLFLKVWRGAGGGRVQVRCDAVSGWKAVLWDQARAGSVVYVVEVVVGCVCLPVRRRVVVCFGGGRSM